MKIACALLVALAASAVAHAQAGDPLKSAECGAALAQLQGARSGATGGANVEGLRSAAAAVCLGTATVPGRPSRIAQQPIAVPPPQIDVAPRTIPLPAPVLAPPPVAIQRAPLPAQCDAAGCWSAGDGTHLRHVPPSLAGPSGMCTQQGGLVFCP